jgi:hypothetical protein
MRLCEHNIPEILAFSPPKHSSAFTQHNAIKSVSAGKCLHARATSRTCHRCHRTVRKIKKCQLIVLELRPRIFATRQSCEYSLTRNEDDASISSLSPPRSDRQFLPPKSSACTLLAHDHVIGTTRRPHGRWVPTTSLF